MALSLDSTIPTVFAARPVIKSSQTQISSSTKTKCIVANTIICKVVRYVRDVAKVSLECIAKQVEMLFFIPHVWSVHFQVIWVVVEYCWTITISSTIACIVKVMRAAL